jgi:hypothetical protein
LLRLKLSGNGDGQAAFERLAEKDPVFYLRLVQLYNPQAVRRGSLASTSLTAEVDCCLSQAGWR